MSTYRNILLWRWKYEPPDRSDQKIWRRKIPGSGKVWHLYRITFFLGAKSELSKLPAKKSTPLKPSTNSSWTWLSVWERSMKPAVAAVFHYIKAILCIIFSTLKLILTLMYLMSCAMCRFPLLLLLLLLLLLAAGVAGSILALNGESCCCCCGDRQGDELAWVRCRFNVAEVGDGVARGVKACKAELKMASLFSKTSEVNSRQKYFWQEENPTRAKTAMIHHSSCLFIFYDKPAPSMIYWINYIVNTVQPHEKFIFVYFFQSIHLNKY